MFLVLWMLWIVVLPSAKGWFSLWDLKVVGLWRSNLAQSNSSSQWNPGIVIHWLVFLEWASPLCLVISSGSSWDGSFLWLLWGIWFLPFWTRTFRVWGRDHSLLVSLGLCGRRCGAFRHVVPRFCGVVWRYVWPCHPYRLIAILLLLLDEKWHSSWFGRWLESLWVQRTLLWAWIALLE